MVDPVSIGISGAALIVTTTVSIRSLRIAHRSLEISEADRAERLMDRAARPELALEVKVSNYPTDSHDVIESDAPALNPRVAIRVTNTGPRPAGRSHVDVWVPSTLNSYLVRWVDAAGNELETLSRAVPDPEMKLPTEDGRTFDTQRVEHDLDEVDAVGQVLYLRVPCGAPLGGEAAWPVRVRARTSGSEAEDLYWIRVRNTRTRPA